MKYLRRTAIITSASAALLWACEAEYAPTSSNGLSDVAMPSVDMDGANARMAKVESGVAETDTTNPGPLSFMAYAYSYAFALPSDAVQPTMEAHRERCLSAGPTVCQVLGSETSARDDRVNASLRLRAEPAYLEEFVSEAVSGVDDAGGELTASNMTSEDLTRQYLDTDARLKAQTTLRDRLQGLLETRNAELADLLEVERELARVQGQIESATTTLAVLRKRVSMSEASFAYRTRSLQSTNSPWAPVARALGNFAETLSYGLAGVLGFVAIMLPWTIFILIPGFFLFRWLWRQRRGRTSKVAASAK